MSLLINHCYQFGEFTLDADQRVLLRAGKPLPLTPKVFDTLLILVENSGHIVEKVELMRRLWPDTFVEEANLTFSVQQLRKSLGDNARSPLYVQTVPRRGYRFIAEVEELLGNKRPADGRADGAGGLSETPDAQSADTRNGRVRLIEQQGSEQAIELANENHTAINEKNFGALPASRAASERLSMKTAALRVATVIALAGAMFIIWKFSNGSRNDLSGKDRVSDTPRVVSPLKFEKLTGTGQSKHIAISPDGKYLAYTRGFDKKLSIWLRHLGTNTNIEIVPAITTIYGLAFTTGGEYLYFVRGNPTALYRIPLLGGVPTKILDELEGDFSISSDDRQIAFIRQGINGDGQSDYSLIIANSDGTGQRKLFTGIHPDRLEVPVWSPGGESIICAYGSSVDGGQNVRIVEVGVADGMKKELSSDRFSQIVKLARLPHQIGLIMCARKNVGDNNQLWRISYPDMEVSQITEGLTSYGDLSLTANADKAAASQTTSISDLWVGSSHEPRNLKRITQATDNFCWTPNGQLVYSSTASGNRDLWIMQPDGTGQRQLTVNPALDSTPAVTPDNRYVVFMSNRTGTFQVWRMDMDGGNQIQLTSGAGKNFPSISPDGKWVLYNTTGDWHLWRVSIEGGDPLHLTDYPASFSSASPDGRMIACVGRNEPRFGRSILILPFEGGQPLKMIEFPEGRFPGTRIKWAAGGKAIIYPAEQGGALTIVKQSLAGGPPEQIASFDEDELFDFGYSFDGRLLAVTRGAWQHDIVLIADLSRY
jgi:DNA-binding winged helix-turn-helix (wHTH) protein/Tol biopolymer transport system component